MVLKKYITLGEVEGNKIKIPLSVFIFLLIPIIFSPMTGTHLVPMRRVIQLKMLLGTTP